MSEETLLGYVVYPDDAAARLTNPSTDIVSLSLLRDFRPNVIYVEGGLFTSEGEWRIPEDTAAEVCKSGGVLIVADVDRGRMSQHAAQYRQAGRFFRAYARYTDAEEKGPVYGVDQRRFWGGSSQILCDPSKMILSDWLRPIYDGIPGILVGSPVKLTDWDDIVASCNSDTSATLQADEWVDEHDACPFASAVQVGNGFAVLIAGGVSSDVWLQGCPHNPAWLTNLTRFLVAEAAEDRRRRTSHRRSAHTLFLSHRSTDRAIVSAVASAIKRGGVSVWLDEEQLVPSQSLVTEISRALGRMTHFVLFWSSHCVGAPWIERELNAATTFLIDRKVPIFIVRLDTTPVPPILADLFRIEVLGESADTIGVRLVEAIERLARSSA
jgi:hypothetical protein